MDRRYRPALAFFAGVILLLMLCILIGSFLSCAFCRYTSGIFGFDVADLDKPALDSRQRSHAPADNVTVTGEFPSWSALSYNNVKVYPSKSGNIDYGTDGVSIHPEATFDQLNDSLVVSLGTTFSLDDTFFLYPAREYIGLPYGPSYDICLNFPGNFKPGNARLDSIAGRNLKISTGMGIVRIVNCSFDRMDIQASDDITADYCAKYSAFQSGRGTVSLVVSRGTGNVMAVSDSGDVKVWLPRDCNIAVDATAAHGKVHCGIPISYSINEAGHAEGSANPQGFGNLSLNLSSRYGDVWIYYQ